MQTCALSWTQSTDESLTALTKELSSARPWRQVSLLRPCCRCASGAGQGVSGEGGRAGALVRSCKGVLMGVGQRERRGQRRSCIHLSPPSKLPVSATGLAERDAEKKAAGQQDRMPVRSPDELGQETPSQRNQTQSSTKSAMAIKGSVDKGAHVFKVRPVLPCGVGCHAGIRCAPQK